MPTRKVAVIAIGGNSLILSKDAQTVQDQYRALCVTGKHIVSLVELGYQVVVTYGNGPQVGFLLWRSEVAHATSGLHGLPLVTCVADTQGGIGYQIQQTLKNEFLRRGLCEDSIAVLTQVVVDKDDPAHLGRCRKPDLKAHMAREKDKANLKLTDMQEFIQLSGNYIRFQEFQLQREGERKMNARNREQARLAAERERQIPQEAEKPNRPRGMRMR